jgi:hypothetical protein
MGWPPNLIFTHSSISPRINNKLELQYKLDRRFFFHIPGVPELPHDILITYSGVKIKTKFERINVEGRRVFKW